MKYFPMFMETKGRYVFICGGGQQALEKIERLKPFETIIRVISPCISQPLYCLKDITLTNRSFSETDLDENPVFVIAAEDPDENKRIVSLCRNRHIPVNAVDQPKDCDFIFPSYIATDRLCVAVSTSGFSPTAAMELRDRIAENIPDHIDDILLWLVQIREQIRQSVPQKDKQRLILRRLVHESFFLDRPLTPSESELII